MRTIHINLVSEQLIPNLIPSFADPNCQGVVLVLGDNTLQEQAARLTRLYQGRGIPVLWQSEGSSSHRLAPLQHQAKQLITDLERDHRDKQWILNATCGTKPMALAFANAFNRYNATQERELPQALVIYTDTQNKEIPLLNDNTDFKLPYFPVVKLAEMLAANGFDITNAIDADNDSDIQQRAPLTRYLGKQFQGDCRFFLGSLQFAANTAADNYLSNPVGELKEKPKKEHAALCQHLVEHELLTWDGESKFLHFNSEDACRYLAGRWLEELTYLTALECGFQQVAMSVEGTWTGRSFKHNNERGKNNEFDVLICHNNQLLTIECKAKYWHQQGVGESTNQDVVLKLDSLGRKLGGLYGERLLISARELPDEMIQRAKDNRIELCDRADGKAIRTALGRFLKRM